MSVYSGVPTMRLSGQALFTGLALPPVSLVLDAPWGYALYQLPGVPRPALVITGSPSPYYLLDLQRANPEGLISEAASPRDIREALLQVADGGSVRHLLKVEDAAALTPRERQVLRLVASGFDNGEIAEELRVGEGTVSVYVSHLVDKLQVKNRVEVALHYLGLLPRFWDLETFPTHSVKKFITEL